MANTDVLLLLSGPASNSGGGLTTLADSETANVSTVWGPSQRGALLVSSLGSLCPGVDILLATTDQEQGTYLSDAGSHYNYELSLRTSSNGTHFLLEKWNSLLGYYEVVTNYPFASMPAEYVANFTVRLPKVGDTSKYVQSRFVFKLTKALIPTSDTVRTKTLTYTSRAASGAIDPTRAIGVLSPFAPQISGLASWHIDAHFYEGGFDYVMAHGIDYAWAVVDTTAQTITVNVRCYPPGYVYGNITAHSEVISYATDFQQFLYVGRTDRFSGALFYVDTVKLKLSKVTGTRTYQLGLADSRQYYAPTLRTDNYANSICQITYYLYNRTNAVADATVRLLGGLDGSVLQGFASKLRVSTATTTDPAQTGSMDSYDDVYAVAKTFTMPPLSYRKLIFRASLSSPTPSDGVSAPISFEVKS